MSQILYCRVESIRRRRRLAVWCGELRPVPARPGCFSVRLGSRFSVPARILAGGRAQPRSSPTCRFAGHRALARHAASLTAASTAPGSGRLGTLPRAAPRRPMTHTKQRRAIFLFRFGCTGPDPWCVVTGSIQECRPISASRKLRVQRVTHISPPKVTGKASAIATDGTLARDVGTVPGTFRTGFASGGPAGAGKSRISAGFTLRWLGDLDSNQGCPGQSREFYR